MPIISLPLLSEEDPAEGAEGSIDPLGLYQIADALATRLVPGVRERMSHPRYLTLMAVGQTVTSCFEDQLTADGMAPAWLAYEWIVVEGLVRAAATDTHIADGLPGKLKAGDAVKRGLHLSSSNYLKTPRVFGFHGIYRLLVRNLDITDEDHAELLENGHVLLAAWERDQKLSGFRSGEGREHVFKRLLRTALREALANNGVTYLPKRLCAYLGNHLRPNTPGRREAACLRKLLSEYGAGLRSEVLSFLVTTKGARVWRKTESERRFHEALRQTSAGELRDLLNTIGAYESFARLLQDAFDDCLYKSSSSGGRLKATQFARLEGVKRAASQVHRDFGAILNRLEGYGQANHFRDCFERFSEKHSAAAWVEGLLEHHFKTQRRKPPDGKAPWFVRYDDGSFSVRALYRRDEGARLNDSYVHGYRTPSLWTFAEDLRLVRNG